MTPVLLFSLACNKGPVEVTPVATDAALAPAGYGRDRKRMNIDQVSASIETVTGQSWSELDSAGETVLLFDKLSGSLGKPDYLAATEEDLAPGLLFQKFLSDAARSTCMRAAEADLQGGEPHLMFHDDPAENAAELLLRFHGRSVAPDDPSLGPWIELQSAGQTPESGWALVCVGLITHPDFYTY